MKKLLQGVFGLYLAAALYVLFFLPTREHVVGGNVVPFHTIKRYKQQYELFKLHLPSSAGIEAQIYGNILLFIPLGMLSPVLFKPLRNPLLTMGMMLFASLSVEGIQRLFRIGQFDVDDIILNTMGGILGLVAFIVIDWSLWEYKKRNLLLK